MKRIVLLIAVIVMAVTVCACGAKQEQKTEDPEKEESKSAHSIAVLVYDYSDDEVAAFREYLQDYIGKEFDVSFMYSESISTPEEALEFIDEAGSSGAEGVISFNTYNLEKEVEVAASKGMYFMLGSGTVTDEAFKTVEDNENFLGVIGPGDENEYMAGFNLAENVIKKDKDGLLLCRAHHLHKTTDTEQDHQTACSDHCKEVSHGRGH